MSATPDSRLRWRCRRGMRELDVLLGWYLEARYPRADAATQASFAALLERQDPELWEWLLGRSQPGEVAWRRIVDEIRSRDCV